MNRFQPASLLVAGALAVTVASPVFGQVTNRLQSPGNAPVAPVPPPPPVVVYQNPERIQNANEIQGELRQILSAYPPSLRQLLAIDPSLLQREDYMAPYPALSAFLQQHPEIIRNPSYYFGSPNVDRPYSDADRRISA